MQHSVLSYLEEAVARFPDKTAFFDETSHVTFSGLRRQALDIAFAINNVTGPTRQPILVFLPKAIISIIAFMGILYSRNCYTPVDIRFPEEKIKRIVHRLHPSAVLVDASTQKIWEKYAFAANLPVVNLDSVERGMASDDFAREAIQQTLDVDPVYIFFTSGSTGEPKGVIINNRNIIDYTDWVVDAFHIDDSTIFGNQTPLYFDYSTQDIYATLKAGATMGIIPQQLFAFPVKVLEFINEKKINFLNWVASAYVNIANLDLLRHVSLDGIKTLTFGGEAMPAKQLNYWRRHLPATTTFANVYGPTEATVNCAYYVVDREFSDTATIPLGKACGNTRLLILDENDALIDSAKPDCLGELCVCGASLSMGYWNNPQVTAEKFVDNPLQSAYSEKIYRTGDLAYYNERGEIMFAGRRDFQIKHSGYRIELGEIEAAAMGVNGVKNVCCLYDGHKKELVLVYEGDIEAKEIRRGLTSILPKYMIPTVYHHVEAFPFNDNGKIDRKVLGARFMALMQ